MYTDGADDAISATIEINGSAPGVDDITWKMVDQPVLMDFLIQWIDLGDTSSVTQITNLSRTNCETVSWSSHFKKLHRNPSLKKFGEGFLLWEKQLLSSWTLYTTVMPDSIRHPQQNETEIPGQARNDTPFVILNPPPTVMPDSIRHPQLPLVILNSIQDLSRLRIKPAMTMKNRFGSKPEWHTFCHPELDSGSQKASNDTLYSTSKISRETLKSSHLGLIVSTRSFFHSLSNSWAVFLFQEHSSHCQFPHNRRVLYSCIFGKPFLKFCFCAPTLFGQYYWLPYIDHCICGVTHHVDKIGTFFHRKRGLYSDTSTVNAWKIAGSSHAMTKENKTCHAGLDPASQTPLAILNLPTVQAWFGDSKSQPKRNNEEIPVKARNDNG